MRSGTTVLSVAIISVLCCHFVSAANELDVSDFDDWAERSFTGNTNYSISSDDRQTPVLKADTEGNASAFYRQGRIDLDATPCLSWRWRIDQTASANLDERTKAGDDFVARVYVVKRGGLAFWRTKTINYVWAASQPVDQRWPNAYAGDNAVMWALNSGNREAGDWHSHHRDIRRDWQQAFDENIEQLDGIAIMTDGDDSNSTLSAEYAQLRFSPRNNEGRCTGDS